MENGASGTIEKAKNTENRKNRKTKTEKFPKGTYYRTDQLNRATLSI